MADSCMSPVGDSERQCDHQTGVLAPMVAGDDHRGWLQDLREGRVWALVKEFNLSYHTRDL